MKGLKIKLFMLSVAMLIGVIICVFFSSIIHFQLKHIKITPELFKPMNCFQSIASDKQHLMLFLCLLGTVLLLSLLLMVSNISGKYESELKNITPKIKTPVSAGQSQHGSAQWLKGSKIKEVFGIVKIGYQNAFVKELIKHGYDPVIHKNNPAQIKKRQKEKKEKPTKSAATNSAKNTAAKKTSGSEEKIQKTQNSSAKKPITIVSKGWNGVGDEKDSRR